MEWPDSPISPQLSAEGQRLWAECLARNERQCPSRIKSPVRSPPQPQSSKDAIISDTNNEIWQRRTNLEVGLLLNLPSSSEEPTPPPSNQSTPAAASLTGSNPPITWMGHRKTRLVHTVDFKSLRIQRPSNDRQVPADLDRDFKRDLPQSAIHEVAVEEKEVIDKVRTLSTAEATSRSSSSGCKIPVNNSSTSDINSNRRTENAQSSICELKSDRMESPKSPQLSPAGQRLWDECLARNQRLQRQRPSTVRSPPQPRSSTAEVTEATSRSSYNIPVNNSSTRIATTSSADKIYKHVPTQFSFQELFKVPTSAIDRKSEEKATLPVSDVPTKKIINCESSTTGKDARGDADAADDFGRVSSTPVVCHQEGPRLPRLVINGRDYSVLREIGKGGSSKVLEAHDRQQAYAIKCVDMNGADETVREGYINEITILKHVQHSRRVIRLYDHEYNRSQQKLYVVMERGDVDMATFIKNEIKDGGIGHIFVKCYWAEMLMAVRDIHKAGIIHSDLKPANFLLVAGKLKLIDFGISSAIPNDLTSIIKDVKCGTPNYISPEALMEVESPTPPPSITVNDDGANQAAAAIKQTRIKIGVKSDVWSLGCILYHMVYGRTPFEHLSYHRRLLAIVDPSHVVEFPPHNNPLVIEVLKKCIVRDVKQRASVDELLNHPYVSRD